MRIYISGKITGTTDYMERFAAAEKYLSDKGHTVVNPAKVNGAMPEDMTWEEYMEMSLCMLRLCGAIFMLKGWEDSAGANVEYVQAVNDDKLIFFQK